MGTRRHGQEGALAPPPSSGKVVKCFAVLVQIAKRSVYELLMLYRVPFIDPAGRRKPQTPNLPTPGKSPAGAHARDDDQVNTRAYLGERMGNKIMTFYNAPLPMYGGLLVKFLQSIGGVSL